jgi:hypothetical protein
MLISHHCLLQPEEARALRFSDIGISSAEDQVRFPNVYGVVKILKPKTRRLASHAQAQHVIIQDPGLACFLARFKSTTPDSQHDSKNFTGSVSVYNSLWRACLRLLGASELG